jgi:O-antigen/teichoic acid export membrane protein
MNSSLQKNVFWTVASRYGSQVLAVVSSLILARHLGIAGFGEYAFISAIVMVGNALSTFGTDMVLIRRIAARGDYSDLAAALVIQLLLSFIFIAAIFLFYSLFTLTSALLIYGFALIPLSFFTIFSIALRGTQDMQAFSLLHFSSAFLQLLAVFLLVLQNGNVTQLAVMLLIVQVFSSLIGLWLCLARIGNFFPRWKFSWPGIPLLLRASVQMAVIGTLRLVYEKLAVSLLPILYGVTMTGLFSASVRVMDAAKLGHMSALTALYPEMALDRKFIMQRTGFGLLLFAAAVLSLTIFLFAGPIVSLLFGDPFTSAADSLRILAWILIPYFVTSYYSLAFVALELERPVLTSLVSGLLLMLGLLLQLSPLYGLRGAAIALLSAEILQAALLWFQWRSYAFPKRPK